MPCSRPPPRRRGAGVENAVRASATEPLYLRFQRILGGCIRSGRLEPGTVLLEGPLAEMFGSSRAPVRQALAALRRERLVSRFDGRGHVVGSGRAAVQRVEVSPEMLGLKVDPRAMRRPFAWE